MTSAPTRPLITTNPYLADPVKRRAMFVRTVISSSAIEGVRLSEDDLAETRGVDWNGPSGGFIPRIKPVRLGPPQPPLIPRGARSCAPGRS